MISSTIYKPTSLLEEFVSCFYFNKSDDFEYTGSANPTLNQELFFNLGDRFELAYPDGRVTCRRNWIRGIQPKSLTVNASGRHLTAGVIFKPWGLYAGFGLNAKALHDRTNDVSILCDLSNELYQDGISDIQFFDMTERALIKSLKKSKLTVTMQSILADLERESLAVLAEKLCRSKKSVIHSFNKLVGLSPQKYYTLKCICDTIEILQNNSSIRLTELAYEQGFYDQAHFIRVFKGHTGLTPKQFRAKNIEA
jgi:AraC-like DNA-binding protein